MRRTRGKPEAETRAIKQNLGRPRVPHWMQKQAARARARRQRVVTRGESALCWGMRGSISRRTPE